MRAFRFEDSDGVYFRCNPSQQWRRARIFVEQDEAKQFKSLAILSDCCAVCLMAMPFRPKHKVFVVLT